MANGDENRSANRDEPTGRVVQRTFLKPLQQFKLMEHMKNNVETYTAMTRNEATAHLIATLGYPMTVHHVYGAAQTLGFRFKRTPPMQRAPRSDKGTSRPKPPEAGEELTKLRADVEGLSALMADVSSELEKVRAVAERAREVEVAAINPAAIHSRIDSLAKTVAAFVERVNGAETRLDKIGDTIAILQANMVRALSIGKALDRTKHGGRIG